MSDLAEILHVPISAQAVRFPKIFEALPGFFLTRCAKKKPGRASKILGILTDGADIGTCKISAQLVQWLLRNSHQKTVTTQLDLLRLNWIDCSLDKEMTLS